MQKISHPLLDILYSPVDSDNNMLFPIHHISSAVLIKKETPVSKVVDELEICTYY